jgi:hypothetical protein
MPESTISPGGQELSLWLLDYADVTQLKHIILEQWVILVHPSRVRRVIYIGTCFIICLRHGFIRAPTILGYCILSGSVQMPYHCMQLKFTAARNWAAFLTRRYFCLFLLFLRGLLQFPSQYISYPSPACSPPADSARHRSGPVLYGLSLLSGENKQVICLRTLGMVSLCTDASTRIAVGELPADRMVNIWPLLLLISLSSSAR